MLEKGVVPGAQMREDTSSPQMMELLPAFPTPLPTRLQHVLLSRPSLTLSMIMSHYLMPLWSFTHCSLHLECWSPNCLLLNSDSPSQTRLTDHFLWGTFLILPYKQSKCFSSGVQRLVRYTFIGVFIPSNPPPEWKYLKGEGLRPVHID